MLSFQNSVRILCAGLSFALVAAASAAWAEVGGCPQPRFTDRAPPEYYQRKNPLPDGASLRAAEARYLGGRTGVSCATCHGAKGDGKGELAGQFDPPPRNFKCARTIRDVPDGQIFWIIRYGSGDTAMVANPKLSDTEIWELVAYLRQLSR